MMMVKPVSLKLKHLVCRVGGQRELTFVPGRDRGSRGGRGDRGRGDRGRGDRYMHRTC